MNSEDFLMGLGMEAERAISSRGDRTSLILGVVTWIEHSDSVSKDLPLEPG